MRHQPVVRQFPGDPGDNSHSLSIDEKELIITAEHPPHFVFDTSSGTIALILPGPALLAGWPSLFFCKVKQLSEIRKGWFNQFK
ncbi:MAG: hypothetical protein VXY89_12600, partial [SAR324 cluster bacterium]|nr:hypothetical protein [SAR324 cluster bacterium]